MSSTDQAGLPPAAAEAPNPLEIFFEKNKKWFYTLAILLVAALAGQYFLRKWKESQRDSYQQQFAAATGLGRIYGESVEFSPTNPQANDQQKAYQRQIDFYMAKRGLIADLPKDIKGADLAKIDALIASHPDNKSVPFLHWVAANKLYEEAKFAEARARCEQLKSGFASHYLCTVTPHPVQVLEEKDDPDKHKLKSKEEIEAEKKRIERDGPDLKDAKPGSPVDRLLAMITADETFRKNHADFFEAPEPDTSNAVVMELSGVEIGKNVEIEIAFYPGAEKHVAAFKKNFETGYYTEMRVHKIVRAGKNSPDPDTVPATIHLGHPDSKLDDRSKWTIEPEAKEEDILEFEERKKALSHFPYVVAAEQEKEGKSSARRFIICASDCATKMDGEYVILGRVVRGTEHIDTIATSPLSDENEENRGQGRPSEDIRVESTKVK